MVASATGRTSPALQWAIVAVCCLALGGCFTTSPRMHSLAESLDRDVPDLDLDHEFGITLGRMSLGLAKGVARLGMDHEEERAFRAFKGIKKVEMATYETFGDGGGVPASVRSSFERRGWETLARFSEDGEEAWIVYKMDGPKLKSLLVMAQDHDQLTMIRLSGRLDRVFRAAMAYSRDEVLDGHHQDTGWDDDEWSDDDWAEDEWVDDDWFEGRSFERQ